MRISVWIGRGEDKKERVSEVYPSETLFLLVMKDERQTRLELATPTLARSCSTN